MGSVFIVTPSYFHGNLLCDRVHTNCDDDSTITQTDHRLVESPPDRVGLHKAFGQAPYGTLMRNYDRDSSILITPPHPQFLEPSLPRGALTAPPPSPPPQLCPQRFCCGALKIGCPKTASSTEAMAWAEHPAA